MTAAEELAAGIGYTAPACDALGVPRASLYRWRRPGKVGVPTTMTPLAGVGDQVGHLSRRQRVVCDQSVDRLFPPLRWGPVALPGPRCGLRELWAVTDGPTMSTQAAASAARRIVGWVVFNIVSLPCPGPGQGNTTT